MEQCKDPIRDADRIWNHPTQGIIRIKADTVGECNPFVIGYTDTVKTE